MPKKKSRRKNFDIVSGILSGVAGHIGGKLGSTLTRKTKKRKKNPSPKSFVGIRVEGNKVHIKVPNKNPGTIRQVKAIVKKLRSKV